MTAAERALKVIARAVGRRFKTIGARNLTHGEA